MNLVEPSFGVIFWLIFPVLILILLLIAIIDILRHEFNGNNKTVWVIVVIFLPIIGPILYFTIGRNQRLK